ncbi:MAG: DUF2786 domain-containing protein [Kofleriaceae bacterium]|nr:DUF2786 domain-containing protein [Kofleriaceae bacterium]
MSVEPLSVALEAALVRELVRAYEWANHARFRERLKLPVIALVDMSSRLGHWVPKGRRLELARSFVLERPWPEVISVLEHEMAHQFVDEVLEVREESAHGETFRRVCEERGIDARAGGPPIAAYSADGDRVLDRIRKLLALAASANQHEAEIAMRRAHELMLRHNIEDAAARADQAYEVRYLGDPSKRGTRVESLIVGLLAQFFFVKAIRIPVYLPRLGKRGNVYELVGTRANVEMAEHVYAFLLSTCERLWRDNRGDARVRSGRDRLSYQIGVINGFHDKLSAERKELRGTGLVWVGDQKLDGYYHARHPRITTRHERIRLDGAHAAGREAGRKVVLHRPMEQGSSGGTRLLR